MTKFSDRTPKIFLKSMLINLLVAIFLEKTITKNNKNASKPSSQTEKDESSATKEGSNTKGKPESNATADNTRVLECVTIAKVIYCDVCGEDLTKAACQHYERRTKIDIIFEKVVEHVDAEVKHCSSCDSTVKGTFLRICQTLFSMEMD